METTLVGCICLLAIIQTVHGTFHGGGNLCQVANGDVGTCSPLKSCYGATYYDKGNSNDCRWWHTCCFTQHYEKALGSRSWHSKPHSRDKVPNERRPKARNRPPTSPPTTSSPSPKNIPNLRIKGCGIRKVLTDFIVGGKEAEYWPWMAAVFYRPQGARMSVFQCGGTVISKRYILTAAHCLREGGRTSSPARVTVRVGGLTTQGNGRIQRVSEVKVHEGYKNSLHYDDIALLKLSEDIESKNVVPACLPSPGFYNSNYNQRNATVTGWGLLESSSASLSRVLREAKIPVVLNSRCNRQYQRLAPLSLPRGIISTQLCAGAKDGSIDACQGDSGGPLALEDRSKKWNVIGIVSFGYGCADPEYPGVYTRVAKYLPWLKANTDIPAKSM